MLIRDKGIGKRAGPQSHIFPPLRRTGLGLKISLLVSGLEISKLPIHRLVEGVVAVAGNRAADVAQRKIRWRGSALA